MSYCQITSEDHARILERIANPQPLTDTMIAIQTDYMRNIASGWLKTDTATPAQARAWLKSRGLEP